MVYSFVCPGCSLLSLPPHNQKVMTGSIPEGDPERLSNYFMKLRSWKQSVSYNLIYLVRVLKI